MAEYGHISNSMWQFPWLFLWMGGCETFSLRLVWRLKFNESKCLVHAARWYVSCIGEPTPAERQGTQTAIINITVADRAELSRHGSLKIGCTSRICNLQRKQFLPNDGWLRVHADVFGYCLMATATALEKRMGGYLGSLGLCFR